MKPLGFGPVVIDTRERSPWAFPDREVVRATLAAGDYAPSLELADRCVIERKSIDDFCSTLTHGRERFEDELRILSSFERALIIVEATHEEIRLGAYRSKATPKALLASVASFHARYGVPTIFCRGRLAAQEFATLWLEKCAKHLGAKERAA
jgi:ERCC4-type nuclease